jgi:hypothetical protein
MQAVMSASNFGPGGAGAAVQTAKNYMREVVTSEDELRSTYAEAERVVRKKLQSMEARGAMDSVISAPKAKGLD